MPRKTFEKKLKSLNKRIITMFEKVLDRIDKTIKATKDNSESAAQDVLFGDDEIDKMEQQIEQICIGIFALEQPIASDLRVVTGCLKIITDLERIADQCRDICEIIDDEDLYKDDISISKVIEMMEAMSIMFNQLIGVFKELSIEKAVSVCEYDDCIDKLFSDIILQNCKHIALNPKDVTHYVDYMFIAKYIERIGDHCTNIAEWVIYIKTGRHSTLDEQSSTEEAL